ncbi:MAG: GAF domain-containing protein [Anaerolineae bacterium]
MREKIIEWLAPRIGRRILLALGLTAIVTLLVAAISIYHLRSVGQGLSQMAERDRLLEANALRLEVAVEQQSDGLLGFLLSGDEAYLQPFHTGQRAYEQAMAQLEGLITSPQEQEALAEIKRLDAAFITAAEEEIALHRQGWPRTAIFLRQKGSQSAKAALTAEIEGFIALQDQAMADNAAKAKRQMARAVTISLALVALALVGGGWAAVLITRSITEPIHALLAATEALKRGDLQARVPMSGTDELAQLAATMNQMAQSLSRSRQRLKNLLTETEQRNQELAALNAIAVTVSQSLDLETTLTATLDKVLEVLEFESGAIYVKDLKTGELQMACHRGLSEAFRRVVAKGIISARAAESGDPIIIDDLLKEPDAPKEVVEEGYRSVASIPLLSKGQVQGVLTTASRQLRRFRQQDVDLLLSIGHQIGVAVENARLFEAEQRRAEQFRVISEVGRRMTSILAVDELLGEIVRLVKETLGYYHAAIGLIEGDELVIKTGAGAHWDDPQFQPSRLKVGGKGITAWVAATGEPLLAPDVSQEPRYLLLPNSTEIRSELAVPLKTKTEVIGVLDVESDRLNAFDESDLVVLQSLAHQAAIAIENARLYEQAQQLAVVEERQRLARELHDSVTQSLFSMTLTAQAARTLLERDPQRAAPQLARLQELAQGALAEMRSLIFQLRPTAVEEEGLVSALRKHIAAVRSRDGLAVDLRVEGERRLPAEQEEGLFRIVQEALNNVVKHAQTERAVVELKMGEEAVFLLVADDGIGFDPRTAVREGETMGLINMRERAEMLGGTLEIDSRPGEGTRIIVVVQGPKCKVRGARSNV